MGKFGPPFEIGLIGALEILVVLAIAFFAIGPRRVWRFLKWMNNLGKRLRNWVEPPAQVTSKAEAPRKRSKVARQAKGQRGAR